MSYTLVPAPTDIPRNSQTAILTNFTSLNTQFATEHIALNAPANNGKHKFVTLMRSLGVVPAGTDAILAQAATVAGNPYLQYHTSTQLYSIPIITTVTGVIVNGLHTIFDFSALPMIPQMGTIQVMDANSGGKSIFTMFTWKGGVLQVPPTSAQLVAGSTWTYFDTNGAKLRMNNTGGADTYLLKITGSSL